MNKLTNYAPIVCAILWLVLCVLAIFNVPVNYRNLYIISTAVLAITNFLWFMKERENDRQTERLNDKQGRQPELNSNDNE